MISDHHLRRIKLYRDYTVGCCTWCGKYTGWYEATARIYCCESCQKTNWGLAGRGLLAAQAKLTKEDATVAKAQAYRFVRMYHGKENCRFCKTQTALRSTFPITDGSMQSQAVCAGCIEKRYSPYTIMDSHLKDSAPPKPEPKAMTLPVTNTAPWVPLKMEGSTICGLCNRGIARAANCWYNPKNRVVDPKRNNNSYRCLKCGPHTATTKRLAEEEKKRAMPVVGDRKTVDGRTFEAHQLTGWTFCGGCDKRLEHKDYCWQVLRHHSNDNSYRNCERGNIDYFCYPCGPAAPRKTKPKLNTDKLTDNLLCNDKLLLSQIQEIKAELVTKYKAAAGQTIEEASKRLREVDRRLAFQKQRLDTLDETTSKIQNIDIPNSVKQGIAAHLAETSPQPEDDMTDKTHDPLVCEYCGKLFAGELRVMQYERHKNTLRRDPAHGLNAPTPYANFVPDAPDSQLRTRELLARRTVEGQARMTMLEKSIDGLRGLFMRHRLETGIVGALLISLTVWMGSNAASTSTHSAPVQTPAVTSPCLQTQATGQVGFVGYETLYGVQYWQVRFADNSVHLVPQDGVSARPTKGLEGRICHKGHFHLIEETNDRSTESSGQSDASDAQEERSGDDSPGPSPTEDAGKR